MTKLMGPTKKQLKIDRINTMIQVRTDPEKFA